MLHARNRQTQCSLGSHVRGTVLQIFCISSTVRGFGTCITSSYIAEANLLQNSWKNSRMASSDMFVHSAQESVASPRANILSTQSILSASIKGYPFLRDSHQDDVSAMERKTRNRRRWIPFRTVLWKHWKAQTPVGNIRQRLQDYWWHSKSPLEQRRL